MDATSNTAELHKTASSRREYRRQWRQEQVDAGLIDPLTGDFVPRYPYCLLHPREALVGLIAFAVLFIIAAGQPDYRNATWCQHVPSMSRQLCLPVRLHFPSFLLDLKLTSLVPQQPARPITVAELAQYDGKGIDKPIYLSIKGDVYDVSQKRYLYGPGGGYSFFAGRDASRAFVTGCFHEHQTHDVRGFSAHDLEVCTFQCFRRGHETDVTQILNRWHAFFEGNDNYMKVGYLVDLPDIDPASPVPTGLCMAQPSH